MKKNNLLILILILVAIIVGCKPTISSEEVDLDIAANTESTISDYLPFMEDTIYDYTGIGNEFAEQRVYFEFIEGNKVQLKIINPATNVVTVLENSEGILTETYFEGEFYHIENLINVKGGQNNILLKEPLVLGNSWTTPDGYTRSITGIDVEVKTPMDTLEALEVTTDLGEDKTQKQYYARDIGMVASIYEDKNGKVETLLKSMEKGPLKNTLELFYPSNLEIETLYTMGDFDFYTNDSIEVILEDLMKNPPSTDFMSIIPDSATINSIKLDRVSWTLRVDFSQELLTDMNAGSSLETEILRSLVNILGRFYDVEKIYISIEGKPYESGHYALADDEYFNVDIEGIELYE